MAGPGFYSRLVAILKVVLPLIALGMLAALFLIPAEEETGAGIVFSPGDIAALGEGLRVTNPTFSGMTRDDDRFRFSAEVVVPDAAPPNRAAITALEGQIDFVDGRTVTLRADTAELDLPEDRLVLSGDVQVETSDGYVMHSEQLRTDLATGLLEAEGAVVTEGPPGTITSGSMRIEPPEAATSARRFLFGNGVRLVYDPPAAPE